MAVDRAELQRMAQLVEFNRERMQTIEQQVRQLEAIRMEQIQAIEAPVSYTHLTLPTICSV